MNDADFDRAFDSAYKGLTKALDDATTKVKKDSKTFTFNLIGGLMPVAVLWGLGIIVSKGFWWTFASVVVPFIGPGTAVYWMVEKFTGGQ